MDIKQPCVETLAEHRDRLGDVCRRTWFYRQGIIEPHVAHMPVAGKTPNDRCVEMIKHGCATRKSPPRVGDLTLYCLRHTYCTSLLRARGGSWRRCGGTVRATAPFSLPVDP